MKIEKIELDIKKIKPYERNNKLHSAKQIDALAQQIAAHGYDQYIVVDEDNVILKGHARLAALKKLEWKKATVLRHSDLTEEQKKAIRIADNKLGEMGEWDIAMIDEEMKSLVDLNFDLKLTAFGEWKVEEKKSKNKDDKISFKNKYEILIDCKNEPRQEELFSRLTEEGYQCVML